MAICSEQAQNDQDNKQIAQNYGSNADSSRSFLLFALN